MPLRLPHATPTERALSAKEDGGFDTEVAVFFGAPIHDEDDIPTEIGADLAGRAKERAQVRAATPPPAIRR